MYAILMSEAPISFQLAHRPAVPKAAGPTAAILTSLTYKSVSATEPISSISEPESLNAVSTLTSIDTI